MKLSRISIGLAMRVSREAAGLSLETLAESTDITLSTLSRTERGERDLSYVEMLALIDVFAMDLRTFRALAETFERAGVAEKIRRRDELDAELTALYRQAIEAQPDVMRGPGISSAAK